jgi:creatinine amidohydrolase/Fe(II)-dependent formamide hydrolase-like protein
MIRCSSFAVALGFVLALLASAAAAGQPAPAPRPGSSPSAASPPPDMPRPIAAHDSVFIEELTWLEIRDAMRAGKTTAIVATGGIEMNGPYLALGKHNYILRATTEAIARRLGDALVAPIVPFVPEGTIDPPGGHMRYPGTISVTQETFKALLTDIVSSLRAHGFRTIVLIGDSGGNQQGMREVADALNTRWAGGNTRVRFVPEYYDYPGVTRWLESQGIRETDEGHHDDYGISVQMMLIDPELVRMTERVAAGRFSINGVPLGPLDRTLAVARRLVEYRAEVTVNALRDAVRQP